MEFLSNLTPGAIYLLSGIILLQRHSVRLSIAR
jgi:hypothetical protein